MAKTKATSQFFGELETTAFVFQISVEPKLWLYNCKVQVFFFFFSQSSKFYLFFSKLKNSELETDCGLPA